MTYYSYDNKHGNKGPLIIIFIVLLCIANFIWYYAIHVENPDSKKLYDIINSAFGSDSATKEDGTPDESVTDTADRFELKGTCYYYQQLSDSEKRAYGAIYNACEKLRSSTSINHISEYEAKRTIYAIRMDHPEFYWLMDDVHTKNNQ